MLKYIFALLFGNDVQRSIAQSEHSMRAFTSAQKSFHAANAGIERAKERAYTDMQKHADEIAKLQQKIDSRSKDVSALNSRKKHNNVMLDKLSDFLGC